MRLYKRLCGCGGAGGTVVIAIAGAFGETVRPTTGRAFAFGSTANTATATATTVATAVTTDDPIRHCSFARTSASRCVSYVAKDPASERIAGSCSNGVPWP